MIKHIRADGSTTVLSSLLVNFIDKLKVVKEESGIGTNELARQSDTVKSQISLFFNYKTNINLNDVLAIVDALGYKLEIKPKHKG